ncbi:MAG: hypothetical protein F6K40_21185 [Okeania sp. SIO3I5]|uniref:hypothetical protein n=1 Tax=Okeania sp. SIO3I5 TaxID=2607805 RepID=UPI0013BA74C3|nr:hypothetical protein [Okeania sp. SIO3I5]NEQ38645.1 hypothetical protein [Okeania sp. SIO3I5]
MLKTFWGRVKQGKIELLEPSELLEGTQVLITLISGDESEFWLQASQILGSVELDKSRLGRTTVLAELPGGKPNKTFTFSVDVGFRYLNPTYKYSFIINYPLSILL